MRAGPLRDVITIERRIGTRTDSGAELDNFEPYLTDIAAAIEDITGKETWAASQQVAADVTTRIRIRYRAAVNETMRVLHRREPGSPTLIDIYDIQAAIAADPKRVEMYLMCVRRSAEGFRSGDPRP